MIIDAHSHILSLAEDPEFTLEYGREGSLCIYNNGRDGNDVIGVGSVTHTEKETEGEDREKSHGKLTSRALICEDWFVWTEHD